MRFYAFIVMYGWQKYKRVSWDFQRISAENRHFSKGKSVIECERSIFLMKSERGKNGMVYTEIGTIEAGEE